MLVPAIVESLTAAGAEIKEARDEGFAHFVYFQDPFDPNWKSNDGVEVGGPYI